MGRRLPHVIPRLGHRNRLLLVGLVGPRQVGKTTKRTTSPSLTRSMHVALSDLKLERLDVIHAGDGPFLSRRRSAPQVAARRILQDIQPLR